MAVTARARNDVRDRLGLGLDLAIDTRADRPPRLHLLDPRHADRVASRIIGAHLKAVLTAQDLVVLQLKPSQPRAAHVCDADQRRGDRARVDPALLGSEVDAVQV